MFKLRKKSTVGLSEVDMLKEIYKEVVGQNEVEEVMITHKLKPIAGIFKGIIEIFKEMGKQGIPAFAGFDDKKAEAVRKAVFGKVKFSDFFDTEKLQTEQIAATNKKTQIQSQEMYDSYTKKQKKELEAWNKNQQQQQQMPQGMTMGQPQYQQYPQQQHGQVPGQGAIGTLNAGLFGVTSAVTAGSQAMQQTQQIGQNMAQNPMGQQPMPQQQFPPYSQPQYYGPEPYGQQMPQPQQKPVNNFDNMTLE